MGLLQHCCIQGEKKYDDNLTRASTLKSAFIGRTDGPYNVIKVGIENPIEIRINTKYCSPYNDYDIIGLIGMGTYGKVFKIRNKMNSHIQVMKIVSENQLKKSFKEEDLIHEIKVLKSVSHENIVKLSQVYRDEDDYFFITPYCIEGNLNKLMIQYKKLPEIIVKKIMKDIISGVYYLHINQLIHGDIKMENILLYNNNSYTNTKHRRFNSTVDFFIKNIDFEKINKNEEDSFNKSCSDILNSQSFDISTDDFSNNINLIHNIEKFDIKLTDFGLYNIFNQRKKLNYKDKIDILYFSSPEVLKNTINEKCDIWSCGVIMYYLLTGELPFKGENESETYDKIMNGNYCLYDNLFIDISNEAKDFINKCFIYESDKRMSSKDALVHPFFKIDQEIQLNI